MTEKPAVACRNCRRPLHWVRLVGWLHGELPQYADEPITCQNAQPVCEWGVCDHRETGPDPACRCRCHIALVPRQKAGGQS